MRKPRRLSMRSKAILLPAAQWRAIGNFAGSDTKNFWIKRLKIPMNELEEIRDQIDKNAKVKLSIGESLVWLVNRDPDIYVQRRIDALIGLLNSLSDVRRYDLYLEDLQRKIEDGH